MLRESEPAMLELPARILASVFVGDSIPAQFAITLERINMGLVTKEAMAHLGADPIPVEPYYKPEYFELEKERIFRRTWLFLGREEELPKSGDYLVRDFETCNASVLFMRGKDNKLRAFHNVCSHRGVRLVWAERGNGSIFTCKYHGWGYGLKGEVRSVPDPEGFLGVDFAHCGLTPVNMESWNGFYFVNFDPSPRQTLLEHLAPIIPQLAEHSWDGFESYGVISSTVDVNWKCMLDNFSETYHLATVHNLSVGDRSLAAENPVGRPIDFKFFGPHRLMQVWGNPKHKPNTVEGTAIKYGGVISAGALQQKTIAHKAVRHPNWQLDVHGIFPSVLIDMAPGFYFIHTFFPIAANRTRWSTGLFFPKPQSAGQRFSQEYSIAAFRDTVTEDLNVLRQQQRGIESGAIKHFQFQLNESMCRHNYLSVDSAVRGVHA
jgi:phenylpropionate dioxygenase-like ring-hydroxylating dioxygenase large terminal subunit